MSKKTIESLVLSDCLRYLEARSWQELDEASREAGYTLEDMLLFNACGFGDQQWK